jgi:DNA-binding NarL/FixJ family response regulator
MLRDDTFPATRRLVLLDLNMPRMNGIEFLKELRADPALRAISVVVLTTSDEERDRVEAYSLNVAGYLLKPVRFVPFIELMVTLNRYWTLMEMALSAIGIGESPHPCLAMNTAAAAIASSVSGSVCRPMRSTSTRPFALPPDLAPSS